MNSNTTDLQRFSRFCVMSSSLSESSQICNFFERGKYCKFGKRCKFLHIRNNSADDQSSCCTKQESKVALLREEKVDQELFDQNQTPCSSKQDNSAVAVSKVVAEVFVKPSERHVSSKSKKSNCFRFFKNGECKFGDNCRFKHISSTGTERQVKSESNDLEHDHVDNETLNPVAGLGQKSQQAKQTETKNDSKPVRPKPVCRYFKAGYCSMGESCWFKHISSTGTEQQVKLEPTDSGQNAHVGTEALNPVTEAGQTSQQAKNDSKPTRTKRLCRYFKTGYCSMGESCRFRHPQPLIETNNPVEEHVTDKKSSQTSSKRRQRTCERPGIINKETITDEKLSELRKSDISQLKKRYPHAEEINDAEGTTYLQFMFEPSDPDWPYDAKMVPLVLGFHKNYPENMLDVCVADSTNLPTILQKTISQFLLEWLSSRHANFDSKGKMELVVRPLLKCIDRSLENLFTDGLKAYQKEIMAKAAGLQFVSAAELQEEYKAEQAARSDNSLEQDTDDEDGSEEEESDDDYDDYDDDEVNADNQPLVTDAIARGTEIKFQNLQLKNSLATLVATKVHVILQCERCRSKSELDTPVARANSVPCAKCSTPQIFCFRASMVHEYSAVFGYADVESCSLFDLVLPRCSFVVGCLACSKEMTLQGVAVGQIKDSWCSNCNAKMRLQTDSIKFQRLQPSLPIDGGNKQALHQVEPSGMKRVPKDPAIQDGKPLPDDGICKHYKKSFRWFRFPCCGKAYPCDICHDDQEEHTYTFANRMICGHCCKEQPYSNDKPCVRCDMSMTRKSTAHWEGGKGCRDKIKMSRNEDRKYSNTNKTVSRHAQALAKPGKKNTKPRHS